MFLLHAVSRRFVLIPLITPHLLGAAKRPVGSIDVPEYVSIFPCTYQAPPECIGVGVEVLGLGLASGVVGVGHFHGAVVLLHQVHQEGGQDQGQEADVPGCDELLWVQPCTHKHTHIRHKQNKKLKQVHKSKTLKRITHLAVSVCSLA